LGEVAHHQNLEIVRKFSDLMWNDRGLDAALELVHPQAVFDWSASRAPYTGIFHGHAAIREATEALWDAWEEWDPQFEEAIEIDPETILFVTFVRARGKAAESL
jgi:ketosteroid isomerase-like protein